MVRNSLIWGTFLKVDQKGRVGVYGLLEKTRGIGKSVKSKSPILAWQVGGDCLTSS